MVKHKAPVCDLEQFRKFGTSVDFSASDGNLIAPPPIEVTMSYSIGVVAATIVAARAALAAKFDETVVAYQPVHANDREQALGAADAFLNLLGPQPDNHDVSITLNGSLTWRDAEQSVFTWANVGVSCGYTLRKEQPAA